PEWFSFETCHGHPHFIDYTAYRLWTKHGYKKWSALKAAHPEALSDDLLASHRSLAKEMIAGHKQGFCIEDTLPCSTDFGCPRPVIPQDPTSFPFTDQNTCLTNQGLSPGWMDAYPIYLDGQWVEAPKKGGTYVLELEANPHRLYVETDYSNNSSAVCVNIP